MLWLFGWSCTSTDVSPPESTTEASVVAETHQCFRCHSAPSFWEQPALKQDCTGCHQAIFAGAFDEEYKPEAVERWKQNIHSLHHVPSLVGVERFQREWFVDYVQNPIDIRPHLSGMMPRLSISKDEAERLADWFSLQQVPQQTASGDIKSGMRILERSNCLDCHVFSGSGLTSRVEKGTRIAHQVMAPDLAQARKRLSSDALAKWLTDPQSVKSDAIMPKPILSEGERDDLVAAILRWPLREPPVSDMIVLPILERPVFYAEVEKEVFKKICWHCHSKPTTVNEGDAGPGNTGGFGYAGAKLDLGSYEGIRYGKGGESVLKAPEGEEPLLVQVLLQRHKETSSLANDSAVLGMPLGLEPLNTEQIQLVRSWIAQGARKE